MKDNNNQNKNNSSEKPAVKTTIVGGRPPGSGKEVDSIPRGIEILVKKASVDPAFKEVLLKERAAAAHRIELSLEDTEVAMLNHIPESQLGAIISATKVNPNMKQAFLGYTATVMLAALTATASAANIDYMPVTGIRSDGVLHDLSEFQDSVCRKAKSDEKLAVAILDVKVTDRVSGSDLKSIKVYLKKLTNQGTIIPDGTECWGNTNLIGICRIEGVPEGRYLLHVAKEDKAYFSQTREIIIIPKKKNSINILLDIKGREVTRGIILEDRP